MAKLEMSPLPTTPSEDVVRAHHDAVLAIMDVQQCELELRKARKLAQQRIIQYENLVLEHQGQMPLPLEDDDASGTASHDAGSR